MTDYPLNEGQTKASEAFLSFMFTDDVYFRLSGPAGVGKTYWMWYVINVLIPKYHETCSMMGIESEFNAVDLTATTNKAAAELENATKQPCSTIHSFLNLKVVNDYKTGKTLIQKTPRFRVHNNIVLFIDEAYMLDTPVVKFLMEGTQKCKIVFIGDDRQLGPVMEKVSPITTIEGPFYELTEPMRNADQPLLQQLCDQLRETVATGVFKPIQPHEGVIDHLTDAELELGLRHYFTEQTHESRILAYTNERVLMYNDHIRTLRGLPDEFTVGEFLVNNSSFQMGDRRIPVEAEVEVIGTHPIIDMPVGYSENGEPVMMKVQPLDIRTDMHGVFTDVRVPCNRDHFKDVLRHYARKKDWPQYFTMQESFADLRQRDAATVHKAQGSSYKQVFVDLDTISTVKSPDEAARLLYVAFSRARSRVFMYGTLAFKFGGVLPY